MSQVEDDEHGEAHEMSESSDNDEARDEMFEDVQVEEESGVDSVEEQVEAALGGSTVTAVTVPERRSRADWEVDAEDWGPLPDAEFLARERQRLSKYKVMLENRRKQMDNDRVELERLRATHVSTRGRKRSAPPLSPTPSAAPSSAYAASFLRGDDEISARDSVSQVELPPPAKKPKKTVPKKKAAPAAAGAAVEAEEEPAPNPFEDWDDSPFNLAAQEVVNEAEGDSLSREITPGMAKLLQVLFKNSKDLGKAKQLAEAYPAPKNANFLTSPRMDAGFYRSDRVDYVVKRADKEMQLSQLCLMAAITAMLPLFELMVERGKKDSVLAEKGGSSIDGLRLAFFANTSLTRRRRQALRPNLDGRVARSVVNAEVSAESLFGENVEETVREAKKADKLVTDLMGPERGRGRGRGVQRGRGGHQRGRGRGGPPANNNNQQHQHYPYNNRGFHNPPSHHRGGVRGAPRGRGRGGHRAADDTDHHSPLEQHYNNNSNNNRGRPSSK